MLPWGMARFWMLVLGIVAVLAVSGETSGSPEQTVSPPGAAAASRPAGPAASLRVERFPSARAALGALLRREAPVVLGVGEYHQKNGGPVVDSSLRRFTRELLPLIERRTSDLIIETWVTEGNCEEERTRVTEDVAETTQRPEATENEIVTLIRAARRYRIQPHLLTLNCLDYKRLLGGTEKVDYEEFLSMTARQLRAQIEAIAKVRLDPIKRAAEEALRQLSEAGERKGPRDLIVVYGGGVHNDLAPQPEMRAYSYAAEPLAASGESKSPPDIVELDVFVPELIEGDTLLLRQQDWFPLFLANASPRHVLLIERRPRSYVLIFRRSRPRPAVAPSSSTSSERSQ